MRSISPPLFCSFNKLEYNIPNFTEKIQLDFEMMYLPFYFLIYILRPNSPILAIYAKVQLI